MTFSIQETIRDLLVPNYRISCPRRLWQRVLKELDRRGERVHEAGAFLLGVESHGRLDIEDVVYYDDLDADAYASGACVCAVMHSANYGPSAANVT